MKCDLLPGAVSDPIPTRSIAHSSTTDPVAAATHGSFVAFFVLLILLILKIAISQTLRQQSPAPGDQQSIVVFDVLRLLSWSSPSVQVLLLRPTKQSKLLLLLRMLLLLSGFLFFSSWTQLAYDAASNFGRKEGVLSWPIQALLLVPLPLRCFLHPPSELGLLSLLLPPSELGLLGLLLLPSSDSFLLESFLVVIFKETKHFLSSRFHFNVLFSILILIFSYPLWVNTLLGSPLAGDGGREN